MCKGICKASVLMAIGGTAYGLVELLWRTVTGRLPVHWTMAVLGGMLFVAIGMFNEVLPWDMPLWLQGVLGAMVVTIAELAAGIVLNLWLGLHIWDYSNIPFNLWGQISLPFSLAWVALSIVAVVADDWLRYWLWEEERPHYTITRRKIS